MFETGTASIQRVHEYMTEKALINRATHSSAFPKCHLQQKSKSSHHFAYFNVN